ncbi:MAG: DUF302 domain-containing protein [Sulfurimonas sp.]
MKLTIKTLVLTLLFLSGIAASASHDIQIYTSNNSKGEITGATIEKAFVDAGFTISGNRNMHIAFKSKFQQINNKMYHLFYLHKKDLVSQLIKVSPRAALFAPLSMSIYMKKGSNDISISSLSIEGMSKITQIPVTNKYMVEYNKLILDTLTTAMPNGHFEKINNKETKFTGNLITSFVGEMDVEDDEIEDELAGLEMELKASLQTVGFIIAGYNKLGDDLKKSGYNKYDFFDAYSICKLSVIFEVSKNHPEAGALAPCTLYVYKEKGSAEVHIEFPSVNNWFSSLAIEDKVSVKELKAAEKLVVDVVNELIE